MAKNLYVRAFRLSILLAAGLFLPSCHDDDDADHGGDAGPVAVPPPPASALVSNRNPAVSGDGMLVAFESDGTDLAPGDSNGATDIFVFNRVTGATTPVSLTATGGPSDGPSTSPSISSDGRFVAFESLATNLVIMPPPPPSVPLIPTPRPSIGLRLGGSILGLPGIGLPRTDVGTNVQVVVAAQGRNIFVRDLSTGLTVLASVGAGGFAADGDSSGPAISGDGRFVAFETRAANLIAGVTLSGAQIVVRDLLSGRTFLASRTPAGLPANGDSARPALSGDGLRVAFESQATDLLPGLGSLVTHIFVHDLITRESILVSAAFDVIFGLTLPANGDSHNPSISLDGRRVAFESRATNLVPGGAEGGSTQTLVRLLGERQTVLVSFPAVGIGPAQGDSANPVLSGAGTHVAFESTAANLTPASPGAGTQVFVHSLITGLTTLASVSAATPDTQGPSGGNGASTRPGISTHGEVVVFQAEAANLPGSTQPTRGSQIFLFDLADGQVSVIP